MRRQPIDGGGSRSLVRTMTSVAGYAEIRTIACQKLELWLQNPKVRNIHISAIIDHCFMFDIELLSATEIYGNRLHVIITLIQNLCLVSNNYKHFKHERP